MKVKQILFVGADFSTIAPKERDAWGKKYAKTLKKAIGKKRKDISVVLYDSNFTTQENIFLMKV